MYLFAQGRDCDQLRDGVDGTTFRDVWSAVTSVCYALRNGTPDLWREADSATAAMLPVPSERCLEQTVAAVVRGVVRYHQAHPGESIPLEPGAGVSCPRKLTGLTVVDEQRNPVPGLARPSGPPAGGTLVRLDGYYVRVEALLIDGQQSGVERLGDGDYSPAYFRTPPAEGRSSITISIQDTLDAAGAVRFFYEPGQPSGPGSPTGSPGGTPPGTATPPSSTTTSGTGVPGGPVSSAGTP